MGETTEPCSANGKGTYVEVTKDIVDIHHPVFLLFLESTKRCPFCPLSIATSLLVASGPIPRSTRVACPLRFGP
jgi:hypothetical protein